MNLGRLVIEFAVMEALWAISESVEGDKGQAETSPCHSARVNGTRKRVDT